MAGMFYSLKETAEKLGKTEAEIKQLAKEGKLREFRDGSSLLFKIEEVEALEAGGPDLEVEPMEVESVQAEPVEAEAPDIESVELEAVEAAGPDLEIESMEAEPTAEVEAPEVVAEEQPVEAGPAPEESFDDLFELEEVGAEPADEELGTADFGLVGDEDESAEPQVADLEVEDAGLELEPIGEAEGTSGFGLAAEAAEGSDVTPEEPAPDEAVFAMEEEETPAIDMGDESDEISLAPESGVLSGESDITDMDTALTGEGVDVLSESDADYDVTDDSMAETVGPAGTATEASLEEIEDDVNLDSFGSGSGLLDLSLQADDTSLGGILDEIYTTEGGEEGVAAEPGSVEDISEEADHVVPEEELAPPEAVTVAPTIAPTAYAEVAPDTQSNILGMLLFLPLAALLYTAIVTVAAQRDFMPSILESVQGLVWYIMGGAAVVAALVIGASFMVGGERTAAPRARKEKKPKAKKEKAPREKKAKAEKPKKEKKEKPKKEKKPLFGKKK